MRNTAGFGHSGSFGTCFLIFLLAPGFAFGATTNQLSTQEKAAGWKLLFDGKTTNGWRSFKKQSFPIKGWVVEDGWLHCLAKGGGDIISDAEFDNFELEWEWKQAPDGNSGLKYFIIETRPSAIGHEYQMCSSTSAAVTESKLRWRTANSRTQRVSVRKLRATSCFRIITARCGSET